jgi:ABC-2 type transport system ATP-binding protein
MTAGKPRIMAIDVSKRFSIGYAKNQGALSKILSLLSGREPKQELVALDSVSLTVEPGEIVAIIGENGSGKSTLLRIIAGIYEADRGKVHLEGHVVSLINLTAGLKDRLAMRDNIFLCSALYGLSRDATDARFDSIVGFSGLTDFVDTKVYQFSEGMKHRLAFSIAVHCNPDILLLDEVFGVGDENFGIKCVAKIRELVSKGSAVIIVTHDLGIVTKQCSRALWLECGQVRQTGSCADVVEGYLRHVKEMSDRLAVKKR